jgi:hypothetical protein
MMDEGKPQQINNVEILKLQEQIKNLSDLINLL